MATLKYVELVVYRKVKGGGPYITQLDGVTDEDRSGSVKDMIRRNIKSAKPDFVYLDSEVTEVVSIKGTKETKLGKHMWEEKVSELGPAMMDAATNKWDLRVRIDAKQTLGRTSGESNAGLFGMVASANQKSYLKSKFSVEQLDTFLAGFGACSSAKEKREYLKQQGSNTITADEQVNTLVCNFLEASKLGYVRSDREGEEQCDRAKKRLVRQLMFLRKHIASFTVNNMRVIGDHPVLGRLGMLTTTNANEVGRAAPQLSSAEVYKYLEQIDNERKSNKNHWPGAYYRVRGEKKVGEPVFDLETKVYDILHRTKQRLDEQAARTAMRFESASEVTVPTLANVGYSVRTGPRDGLQKLPKSKRRHAVEMLDDIKDALDEYDMYQPLHVTEKMMGIHKTGSETRTIAYGSTKDIIRYRAHFISLIGFDAFRVLVYTYKVGGSHPTVVFVCKVGDNDSKETPAVISAMDKMMKQSPRHVNPRMIKDIALAIDNCSSRSAMFRDAVVQTVLDHFCGKSMSSSMPRRSPGRKETRDDLALLISAGERTDDFIEDLRSCNGQLRLEKGDTLADELADLERVREDVDSHDTELQSKDARDKKLTKGINASKVRKVLKCSDCGAPRCVFSRCAISNPNGPTKKDMAALEKHVEENGYKCGDLVRVYAGGKMSPPVQEEGESEGSEAGNAARDTAPLLFCREAHICGMAIESYYYASEKDPRRGARVQTKYVCCYCYSAGKLADDAYVDKYVDGRGGKSYLPICRACVKDGAKLTMKQGRKANRFQSAAAGRKKRAAAKKAQKQSGNASD